MEGNMSVVVRVRGRDRTSHVTYAFDLLESTHLNMRASIEYSVQYPAVVERGSNMLCPRHRDNSPPYKLYFFFTTPDSPEALAEDALAGASTADLPDTFPTLRTVESRTRPLQLPQDLGS